jgi:murein L,D-transpeptidase YcbB/YkuD
MQRAGTVVVSLCALFFASSSPGTVANARESYSFFGFSSDEGTGTTSSSIQDILSSGLYERVDEDAAQAGGIDVIGFYEERDFEPAWTGSSRARQNASRMIYALEHAADHGLKADDYLSGWSQWQEEPEPGRAAARYDIALTQATLRYARDVRVGRVRPSDVYKDVDLPARKFDAVKALRTALGRRGIDSFVANLPPPHDGYRALAETLARYRTIAQQGGWPSVEAGKGGNPSSAVVMRLSYEDPILAASYGRNPEEVRDAIMRFQRRNGLEVDGELGPGTLKALNVPIERRIEQIEANLERWRWLPRELEHRYVVVNVPEQTLDYMRGNESVLQSIVIIGKKSTPTPILRMEVKSVVSNPAWTIPNDIAARMGLKPKTMKAKGITIVDGLFSQKPGPGNPLGELMLDSPNDYGVYMHDTPSKTLFEAEMREKSNGCIRVKEIFRLASLALADDPEAASDVLTKTIDSRLTIDLPLDEPLPVYLVYWTATPGPGGTVTFHPDRYRRDPPLIALLDGKKPEAKKPQGKKPARKKPAKKKAAPEARTADAI